MKRWLCLFALALLASSLAPNAAEEKVTYFVQPVSSTTQPVGETMTIMGTDRDTNSAWFVVVHRDKPPGD